MSRIHRFDVSENTKKMTLEGEDERLKWRVFNGRVEVFWKGRMVTSKSVKLEDRICIIVQGAKTRIQVEKPPSELVAKEVWKNGFYKSKRFDTFEGLVEAAGKLRRKDRTLGCSYSAGKVFINQEKNIAVAYRCFGEKQRGIPYGWYASPEALPEEVRRIIERACNVMVYGENEEYVAVGKVSCLKV